MKKAVWFTLFLLVGALGLRAATNQVFQCHVKVVDARGQPVSGAVVERFQLDTVFTAGEPVKAAGRTTTDRTGTVAITSTNQAYYILLASKPGLALTWGGWYPGALSGEEDATVELALGAPRAVSGVVQDAAGKPVAGVQVWVKTGFRLASDSEISFSLLPASLGRQRFEARTGADGKFRIDGLPEGAKLDLGITKPGMALDRSREVTAYFNPTSLEIEAGQSDLVLRVKPGGAIEGRVVKAEGGGPVAGVRIHFGEAGLGDDATAAAVSGVDGVFRFVDLEAGEYQLNARLGTNEPPDLVGEPVAVTVAAGATNREAKLMLSPGALLEVTVKSSVDEKPIAGAMVYTTAPGLGMAMRPVPSSGQGIARFRLAPGDYQVFANQGRNSSPGGQVTLGLGQTNQTTVSLAAPEPGFKLTGTVVDLAGKPAPRVAVTIFPFHQGIKKTDAEGHFQVELNRGQPGGWGGAQAVIIARDLARNLATALELDEEATNANLRLEPGLTLAGRVADADDKPLTNAQVSLMFHTERVGSSLGGPTRVDGRGRFELKGLPPGRRYGVSVSVAGYGQDSKTIEASDTATNRVELETFQLAKANLRIAGVVLDADDKPVAGAFVNGYGSKQPALNGRTDAKGHFAFAHAGPGAINLSANQARGGGMGSVTAEGGDTNVTIRLGAQEGNFGGGNAQLRRKLTGTVLDTAGKPASKVGVSLFPNYSNFQKKTDEAGRFVLTSDANQFGGANAERVVIARDVERNLAMALTIEEEATNAELRLEPGLTLAGRVTDAEGKPITNAEATLTFWTRNMGMSFGSAAKADAQGQFEIKALPPGRHYGVNVTAKGFGQDSKNLEAGDATTNRVELGSFELARANLRIAGVVVDADDKPVSGAYVNTFGGDKQPALNAQSDSKGRFVFDHVCAGAINLSANSPRGGESGNVSAQGGDTNITIQLGVQEANFGSGNQRPRQKITGFVLDAQGKPVPKIAVNLFPDFSNTQKRTDAAGRFVVTFDPNQFGGGTDLQRVILARDPEHNLAAAVELEEDATNATLKLAPGFTLAGRVTGPDGKALTNAQAQLQFRTPRMTSPLGQSVRASGDGQFEIQGLPASHSFSVLVTAPGYGQDSHNADTGEGDQRRVELDPFQLLVADQRIAGVVVDADDRPVSGAWVSCYGDKQNGQSLQSDAKGRFSFSKLCLGTIRLSANDSSGGYASAQAEVGDTNITIHLGRSGSARVATPKPVGLRGKPLPELAAAGLAAADAPAGQPVLVLLMDAEQRPCRRVLRALGEQAAALKQKGVAVVALQSGDMAEEAFAAWKQEAATPFPVGQLKPDPEKARAAWGAGALPWLILTDKAHRVTAEGFGLEDLEAKLAGIQ